MSDPCFGLCTCKADPAHCDMLILQWGHCALLHPVSERVSQTGEMELQSRPRVSYIPRVLELYQNSPLFCRFLRGPGDVAVRSHFLSRIRCVGPGAVNLGR
jgi:hypothetical protein